MPGHWVSSFPSRRSFVPVELSLLETLRRNANVFTVVCDAFNAMREVMPSTENKEPKVPSGKDLSYHCLFTRIVRLLTKNQFVSDAFRLGRH